MTATSRVLITGGGTAGHTNPGIAVGEALVELGLPADDVHYVGGERGNEGELVSAAGFSIDLLPGRGIQRRLTLENVSSYVQFADSPDRHEPLTGEVRWDAVFRKVREIGYARPIGAECVPQDMDVVRAARRMHAVDSLSG